MLSELCLYLKNWFNEGIEKQFGRFTISDGVLSYDEGDLALQENQYYRIVGSVFNDGVYKYGSESLVDESFDGAVWPMAVPPDVIGLVAEIAAWQEQYGGSTSANMSPFSSESFGGYSYSKSSGGSSDSQSSVPTWQAVYADRLRRYRKI